MHTTVKINMTKITSRHQSWYLMTSELICAWNFVSQSMPCVSNAVQSIHNANIKNRHIYISGNILQGTIYKRTSSLTRMLSLPCKEVGNASLTTVNDEIMLALFYNIDKYKN